MGPAYRWARRIRALGRYAIRRPHDPDFAAFALLPGDGLFLDIGASIGQSALSFRIFNRRSPILSLEPLPGHRRDLEFVRRVLPGHDIEGLSTTIERCRPVLPIERSERVDEVIERLAGRGYEPKVYDSSRRELVPYRGQDAVNLFYLHGSTNA